MLPGPRIEVFLFVPKIKKGFVVLVNNHLLCAVVKLPLPALASSPVCSLNTLVKALEVDPQEHGPLPP